MSTSFKLTARKRLVSTLSEEILTRSESYAYRIPSEHALCERFNLSRVTVRLALSDLETKGLIYRKHGKGTFAYGRTTLTHRGLAVLLKESSTLECWPMAEMLRGIQSYPLGQQAPVTVLSVVPAEWPTELVNSLAGVVIFPENFVQEELEVLKNRKLPYIFASKTQLPGARVILGQVQAARTMTERLLSNGHKNLGIISGFHSNLDAHKREGVHQAMRAAGLDPKSITEIAISAGEESGLAALNSALQQANRPSGWIAFDDSFAAMLHYCVRRQNLRVPHDISIVSFHDLPYFRYMEPALSSVRFEFFKAGQMAAEILHRSFLTGEEVQDIKLEPTYRTGESIAPCQAAW